MAGGGQGFEKMGFHLRQRRDSQSPWPETARSGGLELRHRVNMWEASAWRQQLK